MQATTRAGRLVRQSRGPDGYSAFIPAPLPPTPAIEMTPELTRIHESAVHAVGRLDGASRHMDPDRLLYMYVRKEAVLSSSIEGTQSTLSDLLQYEADGAPGTPIDDVREVLRYVAALHRGLELIETGELPLSLRLLREMHGVLMKDGRGNQQTPGEFRRSQNWVGGTRPGNARYVPPPPHELMPALGNLESYLHDEFGPNPAIIKAGLAHAQFETIHPFLDGNGRVGRLLINLMFVVAGVLSRPFLYLSLYLRRNRSDYYDALQRIRTHGAWEDWIQFYLIGVESVAREAADTTVALHRVFDADQKRVASLGRAAGSALRVYELLKTRVIVSIPGTSQELGITFPTVRDALDRLHMLGIVREVSGRARNKVFAYDRQLQILNHEPR